MKKADYQVYKERLLGLRDRLRGDVTSMAEAALRKSGTEGSEASSMPTARLNFHKDCEQTINVIINSQFNAYYVYISMVSYIRGDFRALVFPITSLSLALLSFCI